MIVSEDPDYLDTKLVKQGFKKLDPTFQKLADWIQQQFDTSVLNIYYDKIEEDTPRLNIIFEYENESEQFSDNEGNFDSDKQKLIAEKFIQILQENTNTNHGFFAGLYQKSNTTKFDTERLFIIFSSFEPVSRIEVNHQIPQIEIDNLKHELNSKNIWEIYREFETTTFFFYTEKQLEQYLNDDTTKFLKNKYFDLLKKYDEFDYFRNDTDFLNFDSKENFDRSYQSNWFYYSRR